MHRTESGSRPLLALLATAAVAGQIVLLASALLLPLASEYSLIRDTMSELVLGRFGWVQTVAFVAAGIGALALAYTIRQLTEKSWQSRIGAVLVGIYGIGAILVAIFPTDRIDSPADVWAQSQTGMIHIYSSFVSFVCMIVAMFILTWAFMREPRWRAHSPWLMLFLAAAPPLFFGQSEGPWVGLLQRLMVGAIAAWIVIVALKARAIVASAEPQRSVSPMLSSFGSESS